MRRGIIYLTNLELSFLKNLVDKNHLSEDTFFLKLTPDLNSATDSEVFFNQEQAEIILDLLPVPNQTDDQVSIIIRQKLTTFLQSSS